MDKNLIFEITIFLLSIIIININYKEAQKYEFPLKDLLGFNMLFIFYSLLFSVYMYNYYNDLFNGFNYKTIINIFYKNKTLNTYAFLSSLISFSNIFTYVLDIILIYSLLNIIYGTLFMYDIGQKLMSEDRNKCDILVSIILFACTIISFIFGILAILHNNYDTLHILFICGLIFSYLMIIIQTIMQYKTNEYIDAKEYFENISFETILNCDKMDFGIILYNENAQNIDSIEMTSSYEIVDNNRSADNNKNTEITSCNEIVDNNRSANNNENNEMISGDKIGDNNEINKIKKINLVVKYIFMMKLSFYNIFSTLISIFALSYIDKTSIDHTNDKYMIILFGFIGSLFIYYSEYLIITLPSKLSLNTFTIMVTIRELVTVIISILYGENINYYMLISIIIQTSSSIFYICYMIINHITKRSVD